MVIFVVRGARGGAREPGALTNGTPRAILRTRRHIDPPSEAWIVGGQGSIVMRFRRMARVRRGPGAGRTQRTARNNRIPEGEIGIAPVSGNPLWTSVGQVATLTLCAAC
ncbi:hypothetical protein GCM10010359_58090 [Streptomyces morookaense]|nr:hypothetical protein GCM10010359_58090 [Streptomyces morookaense]